MMLLSVDCASLSLLYFTIATQTHKSSNPFVNWLICWSGNGWKWLSTMIGLNNGPLSATTRCATNVTLPCVTTTIPFVECEFHKVCYQCYLCVGCLLQGYLSKDVLQGVYVFWIFHKVCYQCYLTFVGIFHRVCYQWYLTSSLEALLWGGCLSQGVLKQWYLTFLGVSLKDNLLQGVLSMLPYEYFCAGYLSLNQDTFHQWNSFKSYVMLLDFWNNLQFQLHF